MSLLETIGLAWVIFTSTLATIGLVYLSAVGLRSVMRGEAKEIAAPAEVKELFKIAG